MLRKILTALAAVTLLLLAVCTLWPHAARAAGTEKWKNWGVAPYAANQRDACRKAPQAIDGFDMPLPVKEHFKQALGPHCDGGVIAWLTPGLPLEQMWSGPDKKHHHDRLVDGLTVADWSILKAPDGRPYLPNAVSAAARALSWSFEYEGKTYMLYLPRVCFNWSWAYGPPPVAPVVLAPPPEQCATVKSTVVPGDEVRFAVLAQKYLPASACWQLCDGEHCSAPPSPPCDFCDWIEPMKVIPTGFEPLHTGRYVARASEQKLRFPVEVMANYVAICVTREGPGQSNAVVIMPPTWKDRVVELPPDGFPLWGNENIGRVVVPSADREGK